MKFKKQFIAGARCPQCQQQDVLQLWQPLPADTSANSVATKELPQAAKRMHCTACGHEEGLEAATAGNEHAESTVFLRTQD